MALLRPNKGTAPSEPRVKPSRAELLMSATQALAAEQVPDRHTMTAIEGGLTEQAAEATRAGARGTRSGAVDPGGSSTRGHDDSAAADSAHRTAGGDAAITGESASDTSIEHAAGKATPPTSTIGTRIEVRALAIDAIRLSPFQPKGRPSAAAIAAVSEAIRAAGSLEALVSPDGSPFFAALGAEAARLAELAYDVAEHGLSVPVELRTLASGEVECLSGHRRLAAARLAGLSTVPTLDRGAMSNASAAATVLRGNLHRENFTTWQEATLVTEVQERRRADGYRDNVRTLGAVMGWSHGKVNMLLRIRRALSSAVLDRAGGGDGAPIEELLARAPYRDLERLAGEPDDERRIAATRRMLGLGDMPATSPRERLVCVHRPKRGGGFVIEVNVPVEALDAGNAALLRAHLETQLTRVGARLSVLGHH